MLDDWLCYGVVGVCDVVRDGIIWSNYWRLSPACFRTIEYRTLLLELPSRLVILIVVLKWVYM